jgi:hypothetical protein
MSLVGSVLLGARELFTDLPQQTLAPPVTANFSIAAVSSSTPLPVFTYYIVLTALNQWGETIASSEVSLVVAFNQTLQFTANFAGGIPLGATKMRAYIGTQAGQENQYNEFTSLPYAYNPAVAVAQVPPTRNTAYLPDSDGGVVSVSALYRWLNDGLKSASTLCGGIPDFGGVGTVVEQPIYTMNGVWKKIDTAWYDGYPLYLGNKNDVFRRNNVTGTSGTLTVNQVSDRLIVELWPQPSRTSGQTTLSGNGSIGPSDTSALLATSNFVLGFGLAQIGTEIVEFAGNEGGTLQGLTRGMSGTLAASWPDGTAVTELNLMISGWRVPSDYSVGAAASTFTLAPGWEEAMITYLEARFLKAEKQYQEATGMMKEFTAKVMNLKANRIVAGPRQIQAGGGYNQQTYNLGTVFGGVIIP